MHQYEVEIKSLLGAKEYATRLREAMARLDPTHKQVGQNSQLNHYFHKGDIHALQNRVRSLLEAPEQERLQKIAEDGKEFSVRTRKMDNTVLLVVKASVDDTTSENGIARIEFEAPVALTLDELDQQVLDAAFEYQAKWSRDREEYLYKGANVTIDRNAGYGYLAEFEKVVTDADALQSAEQELRGHMRELGVEELKQDRLARMFAHYNANWSDYYGTDKVFVIE
jgi:adenylate cyclase class IV